MSETTTKPVRDLQQGDFYVWEGPQDRVYTWTVSTVEPTGSFTFGSTSTRILRIRFAHPTGPIKYIDAAEDAPATVLQDPMREHNHAITEAQRTLSALKDALSHAETSVYALPTSSYTVCRSNGTRYAESLKIAVASAEAHLVRVGQEAGAAWDALQEAHRHSYTERQATSNTVQMCSCGEVTS